MTLRDTRIFWGTLWTQHIYPWLQTVIASLFSQRPKAEQGNFINFYLTLEITRSLIRSQAQGKHRNTLEDADISTNFVSKLRILRI